MIVPQIDIAAHLGGFVFGALCGAVLSQPIDMKSLAKRWRRNVLLLAGAALLFPAACMMLPLVPVDNRLIETEIQSLDQQASHNLDVVYNQWQQREITDQQFVELVELEVIPAWQAALEWNSLVGYGDVPQAGRQMAIHQYLNECLTTANSLQEGVRSQDPAVLLGYVDLRLGQQQRQREIFPPP